MIWGPSGIGVGLDLTILNHSTAIEHSFIVDRRLHIERPIQLNPAPAHIKDVMVVEIQQGLIGFFERHDLIAKSVNIAGQIKVFE